VSLANPAAPHRSLHAPARAVLSALALAAPLPVLAQNAAPTPPPPIFARDEKDFEGLTSLALGSGARAFGMGGAFLARADDATAASWNPAGLSYLRRPELSLVGARNAFDRGPAGEFPDDTFEGHTPDFLAAAYPLEFGPVGGSVQVGYQRVFSFAGERLIQETAPTRVFTSNTEGGFDVLAVGTGLRVTRTLRVGVTANRWFRGYTQNRFRSFVPRGRQATWQDIDYSLSGWNANLGVIWSPTESLNLGLVGKTPFTGEIRLHRFREDDYSGVMDPLGLTENEYESDDVRLKFPGALGFGASWRPRSALTLSADYTRTFWSSGRIYNFFVLQPTEPGKDRPVPVPYPELPYPTLDDFDPPVTGPPHQFDTEQFRFGVEYVVLGSRLKVPLRAGVFTDRQYFADGTGRPPVFLGFSVGSGLILGPVLFDVAYVREQNTYVDSEAGNAAARVTSVFQRVFVSLIYRHGG
jgi:hypothetical protein